jgi:hypothetical protein
MPSHERSDSVRAPRLPSTRDLGLLLLSAALGCSLEADGTGQTEPVVDVLPVMNDAASEPPGPAGPNDARSPEPADAASMIAKPRLDAGRNPGDGSIGWLDAALPLDAGVLADAVAPSPDGSTIDGSQLPPGTCSTEGTFAFRAEFNVSWGGTSIGQVIPVLESGQDKIVIYATALLTNTEKQKSTIEIVPCGISVPEFVAGNPAFVSEVYSAYIPDSTWEQPTIPHFFAQTEFGCVLPGCSFATARIEPLLGAPLDSSSTSFWNANARNPNAAIDARDDDADGQPGLTLTMRGPETISSTGKPYSYPPLGALAFARARRIMLTMGVRARFVGTLGTCDDMSGSLMDGEVRTRAVGCTAFRQNPDAEVATSVDFVRFLDDNLPQWQFESGTFKAIRLDSPTCTKVRAAFE